MRKYEYSEMKFIKSSSDSDDILSSDYVRSLEPVEFEQYCKKIIEGFAEESGLKQFKIIHDARMESKDGKFQIDIYFTYTMAGIEYKTICECKHYQNPVKRDIVLSLYQKMNSLGVHKGILLSSSGFQKGAISFAERHGISLIHVYDYNYELLSHSSGLKNESNDYPFLIAEKMMPPVQAYCFIPEKSKILKIYPTKDMVKQILIKQASLLKEKLGIDVEAQLNLLKTPF